MPRDRVCSRLFGGEGPWVIFVLFNANDLWYTQSARRIDLALLEDCRIDKNGQQHGGSVQVWECVCLPTPMQVELQCQCAHREQRAGSSITKCLQSYECRYLEKLTATMPIVVICLFFFPILCFLPIASKLRRQGQALFHLCIWQV